MRNVHNWVRLSLGVGVTAACVSACGGVTDIDFLGYPADSGVGGAGSGGTSAGGGAGGGTAATGNVGGGGTAGVGAGGSGAVGGGPSGGGSGGGSLVCGNEVCSTPSVPIGQVDSCCAGDKCGISSSFLGNQCIEQNQPGAADPNCPPQTVQGFTLQGCCKPTGICGVLDTFIGLGCVDPSQFGGPPGPACGGGTGGVGGNGATGGTAGTGGVGATGGAGGTAGAPGTSCGTTSPDVCSTGTEKCCVIDPGIDYCALTSADCTCTGPNCTTLPVSCDGPEDCPGQVCCGTFSFPQNRYVSVQCENSCTGPTKREICHLGQQCLNPTHTCSPSAGLPSNLNRCN